MGISSRGATAGGTALLIPMLVQDLRDECRFDVRTMAYGRWGEGESFPAKIMHQLVDLGRYPFRLRRTAPHLVHLHSSFDRKAILRDVAFAVATRLFRRPLLLQWHGSETELLRTRSPLWWVASRLLLRSVDALAVLSTEERRDVQQSGFRRPCHVVKNSVDLSLYTQGVDLHSQLGIPPAVPLFLFIARLIPAKGLLDAVEALARMRSQASHLIVVGDGPSRAPAEERARRLRLHERIHFVGQVTEEEARCFYCGCDVLVLPTYHAEGFPMSIFQAVASGMGIVTTRIRAAADHLREPDNCLFVPARDPDALASVLEQLLSEPQLLRAMRAANRRLSSHFERHVVASEFAEIYATLLE
ncbi:MAG: glycosyltransferase family 4 protein [Candidatus Latescibacterota bacterium]|nr:MAG: glycosyltransferase family 4 protein [Candidatus Latescibacterota bacterium]